MKINICAFPKKSIIAEEAITADFSDSYSTSIAETQMDPLEIYLLMVNKTPIWINRLLTLRNKIVKQLGLKDVGNLGSISHFNSVKKQNLIGTRLDIFTIESFSQDEMILIQKDKHLE